MTNLARGVVLDPQVDAPTYCTARYGEVLTIDTVATYDADDDWRACNTAQDPLRVVPGDHADVRVGDGVLRAWLPPVSWNVFAVKTGKGA